MKALTLHKIEVHRVIIRPDWNPNIEVAYYLVLNVNEFENILHVVSKRAENETFLEILENWRRTSFPANLSLCRELFHKN